MLVMMLQMISVIEVNISQKVGFRIGMWNVHALLSRINEVKTHIRQNQFYIFAVVETWLKDGQESILSLDGYHAPVTMVV